MPYKCKLGALTVLSLTVLLTACVAPGKFRPNDTISRDCPAGSVTVEIKYGDSYIDVTPKAHLKENSGIKFVLKPREGEAAHSKDGPPKDTESLMVTITGEKYESSGDTPVGDTSVGWLNKSGAAGPEPHKDLIVCAADDQAEGTYYYSVQVENVGKLDPRADVKN